MPEIVDKLRKRTDFYEGSFYIPEKQFYTLCDLVEAVEGDDWSTIRSALKALRAAMEEEIDD